MLNIFRHKCFEEVIAHRIGIKLGKITDKAKRLRRFLKKPSQCLMPIKTGIGASKGSARGSINHSPP